MSDIVQLTALLEHSNNISTDYLHFFVHHLLDLCSTDAMHYIIKGAYSRCYLSMFDMPIHINILI